MPISNIVYHIGFFPIIMYITSRASLYIFTSEAETLPVIFAIANLVDRVLGWLLFSRNLISSVLLTSLMEFSTAVTIVAPIFAQNFVIPGIFCSMHGLVGLLYESYKNPWVLPCQINPDSSFCSTFRKLNYVVVLMLNFLNPAKSKYYINLQTSGITGCPVSYGYCIIVNQPVVKQDSVVRHLGLSWLIWYFKSICHPHQVISVLHLDWPVLLEDLLQVNNEVIIKRT